MAYPYITAISEKIAQTNYRCGQPYQVKDRMDPVVFYCSYLISSVSINVLIDLLPANLRQRCAIISRASMFNGSGSLRVQNICLFYLIFSYSFFHFFILLSIFSSIKYDLFGVSLTDTHIHTQTHTVTQLQIRLCEHNYRFNIESFFWKKWLRDLVDQIHWKWINAKMTGIHTIISKQVILSSFWSDFIFYYMFVHRPLW